MMLHWGVFVRGDWGPELKYSLGRDSNTSFWATDLTAQVSQVSVYPSHRWMKRRMARKDDFGSTESSIVIANAIAFMPM